MMAINEASQSGSDISAYVNTIENCYKQEIEKINFMMTRLNNFKNLLREEQQLADKFARAHEQQQLSVNNSIMLNEEVNILDDDF
jgi:uncharacterized protein YktA (UPF0223 family)